MAKAIGWREQSVAKFKLSCQQEHTKIRAGRKPQACKFCKKVIAVQCSGGEV